MVPNILEYDLEMFPGEGYTWGKWEQNVIEFTRKPMICSVAYRWLGQREVKCIALPDFARYKRNRFDNGPLIRKFFKVMDKADITIAHNGIGFDEKKTNSDIAKLGLFPPAPHKVIDTLRIARSRFGFVSNKLDDLAVELGVKRKVTHEGFAMWKGCMDGKMSHWRKMIRYNIGDIDTLDGVYHVLKPWARNHPNLNAYENRGCPTCGSYNVQARGYVYLLAGKRQRFQCQDCGKWSSLHIIRRGKPTEKQVFKNA